MTSWSIISVLRYVYIEHKEWIERKWSGPKELRYIALFAQFFSFSAANLIDLGLLAVFATPYGWPSNSLITQVPQNVHIFLVPCLAFLFTLPVVVSGIFYVLLVCSRSRSCSRSSLRSGSKKKFSNKDEVDWSISNRENIDKGPIESEIELSQSIEQNKEIKDQCQYESAVPIFDYNSILQQSGQPCEESNVKTISQKRNVAVFHGYFGAKSTKSYKNNNNSCFQNTLHNIEMCEIEEIKTKPVLKKSNVIHVRNTNLEVKISVQNLTDPHVRNESSNNFKNIKIDAIEVDPTFKSSDSQSVEKYFSNPTTNNTGSTDKQTSESICNQSETNLTSLFEKLSVNKQEAERVSAMRSLKTNLIMVLFVGLSTLFLIIPSKMWQTYFCIVDTSIEKALLPIVTTMANFGTVQSVARQFWKKVF